MFLEDKLEEIHNNNGDVVEKARKFLHVMTENIEQSVIVKNGMINNQNLANVVKRIDTTWRKFAKKHNYKEDFFETQSIEEIRKINPELVSLIGWGKGGKKRKKNWKRR